MNATVQAMDPIGELKSRLKTTWMTGDYDQFSRYMEKGAELFFSRLEVIPGCRLLDVGCGAGQLAEASRARQSSQRRLAHLCGV